MTNCVMIHNEDLIKDLKQIPQYLLNKALNIIKDRINPEVQIFIDCTKRDLPTQKIMFCNGRTSEQVISDSNGEVGSKIAKKYANPNIPITDYAVTSSPYVLGTGAMLTISLNTACDDSDADDILDILKVCGWTVTHTDTSIIDMTTKLTVTLEVSYGDNPLAIDITSSKTSKEIKFMIWVMLRYYFTNELTSTDKYTEDDLNSIINPLLTKDYDMTIVAKAIGLFKVINGKRNTSNVLMLSALDDLASYNTKREVD